MTILDKFMTDNGRRESSKIDQQELGNCIFRAKAFAQIVIVSTAQRALDVTWTTDVGFVLERVDLDTAINMDLDELRAWARRAATDLSTRIQTTQENVR